jgi:Ca2+/Na+ antiporter
MNTLAFKEFLISLVVALILCVIFALITRKSARRTGFVWFFLFVLVATWAGGVWIRPFGPALSDVRWLQFLVVGLLVVLMFALFAPLKPPRGRQDTLNQLEEIARQKELTKVTYITLGILFWVVFVILIIAIIIRYVLGNF